MRRVIRASVWIGVVAIAAAAFACGGSSPTTPSTPPSGGGGTGGGGTGGGGTPAPASVTITVTASGVSASSATLAAGGMITWVNNDNVAHDMSSNPHPQHTDCPGMTSGDLNPGQQRTVGPVSAVRVCGFHDHLNPGSLALMGQVTVQ